MPRHCKHGKKADGHCRKAPKSGSCKCKTYQGCLSYIRTASKFKMRMRKGRAARHAPVSSMVYPAGVRTIEGW